MPQPREKTDVSASPDPELDPVMNPLLAANMGRWAAVYSNTPPETRDQAIHALLRELEKDSPREGSSSRSPGSRSAGTEPVAELDPQPVLICRACAHSNLAEEKFCGMCGALLPVLPETAGVEETNEETNHFPAGERRVHEPELSPGSNPASNAIPFLVTQHEDIPLRPLPQHDLPSFAVEPEPAPNRYRLYAGLALALLLAGLLYWAWRRTDTTSGGHPAPLNALPQEQAAPANSMPQPSAAATATTKVSPTDLTPSKASASSKASAATAKRAGEKVGSIPEPPAPPKRKVVAASATSNLAPAQTGTEEWATAERYLNGDAGRTRDSREAVPWLWKAVGKGNLAATVALSDLYLRGDGVPKNCDQGRLLLDAAARKGAVAAAQRLRNLQAFGCQ